MGNVNGLKEIESRERRGLGRFNFGISYCDHALHGIAPADLIILTAKSGAGKTQACCEIMDHALEQKKRVLYVALEAENQEIESRLKWKLFMKHFLASEKYKGQYVDFVEWMYGAYVNLYPDIENLANDEFQKKYENATIHYKGTGQFTVTDLIDVVMRYSDQVDFIIIDHLHYFDFDPAENENRAIKTIVSQARDLAVAENKPILMVAHIRKADKRYPTLVPDQEDLHGSSDIFKICTKLIAIAPGKEIRNGSYETYMRCSKFRFDGGVSRFVAQMFYSPKGSGYEKEYKVGFAHAAKFEDIGIDSYPMWARGQGSMGSTDNRGHSANARNIIFGDGKTAIKNFAPIRSRD